MYDEKRYALDLLSILLGRQFFLSLVFGNKGKNSAWPIMFILGATNLKIAVIWEWLAGVPHGKLSAVVENIVSICSKIKRAIFPKAIWIPPKSYLRGQTALRFEASDEIAHFVVSQELFYNEIKQPADILEKIEAMGKEDILKIARELFSRKSLV